MVGKKAKNKGGSKRIFIIVEIAAILLFTFINLGKPLANYDKVNTEKIKKGNITARVSGPGRLKPTTDVSISSSVTGRITKIHVTEGELVKKGQILMELDAARYQAGVQQASAGYQTALNNRDLAAKDLDVAKATYARQVQLHNEGLISDEAFSTATSIYNTAEANYRRAILAVQSEGANIATAKDNLGETVFTSPIDGVIVSLPVKEGENAIVGTMNNAGTTLMTISNLNTMEVDTEIDETDIVNIKIGQEAEITVDALPDQTFKGRVIEVGNTAYNAASLTSTSTETSVMYLVKVLVIDPDPRLKPYMSCTTEIITESKDDVLSVPIQAVVRKSLDKDKGQAKETAVTGGGGRPSGPGGGPSGGPEQTNAKKRTIPSKGQEGVYVLVDGTVKFVPVTSGISDQNNMEVTGDIKEGDEIVVGPFNVLRKIKDGVKVRVDNSSAAASNGGGDKK